MKRGIALLILCTLLGGWTHGNAGGGGGGSSPVVAAAVFTIGTPQTTGNTVGTATATNSPTGWSITAGDSAGDFAISSGGVITLTSQGQTDYNAGVNLKSATLTLQASNGSGSGTNNNTINAYADGSINAGAGYIQHSDFFTSYARQSGQTYSTRPPWQVAGVDYAAGIVSNATITIASPAVITETSHGHSAGDKVSVFTTGALPTGITAQTVEYFVLAAGLTTNTYEISTTNGGSAVNTSGTQSGVHTVLKDPSVDALPASCTYNANGGQPYVLCTGNAAAFNYWYFNDVYLINDSCTSSGSWTLNNNYFKLGSNTTANLVNSYPVELVSANCSFTSAHNVYDGNVQNLTATQQKVNMPAMINAHAGGAISFQYDAFINTVFRGIGVPIIPTTFTIKYIYAEGVNYNNGGGHGEFIILNDVAGTWASLNIAFTTGMLPNNFGGGSTAFWYIGGGTSPAVGQTITAFNFNYNVVVQNLYEFVGGISNGSGSAGTIINITSTAANHIFGTCSDGGGNIPLNTLGGVAANTNVTTCVGGTGGIGTYNVNNSQLVAPGTTMAAQVSGQGITGFDAPTVTTSNFISNYFDPTGMNACINIANATPTLTNNVNLRDGSLVDTTHCNGHF